MLHHAPKEISLYVSASDGFKQEIMQHAALAEIPANTLICNEGKLCDHLPLLLSGTARVFKASDTGKEITLYRIYEDESCVLTAPSILGSSAFPATAETETQVQVLLIPKNIVLKWFTQFDEWRTFISQLIGQRMSDIFTIIDQIAFQRMDVRLANYLISKAENNDIIDITHQHIADKLGTAREVITRLLHDFEAKQFVKLQRGRITVRDKASIKHLM